ncbi:TrmH family RNA methyltransferase [Candidatus Magnetomonas plexicatena]|uniref:TrmH family RNA methyltransferase n=1 Tax=Candidatus Magnetomonas plexicatena TaxID=2552947 RepID=UPI001C7467AB|nr:RNA methyltransferase [Nitrospirales bacterium LBB_01]
MERLKYIITSVQNEKVKDAVVKRQRKAPEYKNSVFVEGKRVIETALISNAVLQRVFITSEFLRNTANRQIIENLSQKCTELYEVSAHVMDKLSDTESPQGIVALFKISESCLLNLKPDTKSVYLVLDGISEPGNVGTIVRTAEAFGVSGVITLPGTADPFSAKAVRASAGCVFNIAVIKATVDEFLKWINHTKLKLISTVVSGGVPLYEATVRPPFALVLGQESEGVSRVLVNESSVQVMIPMRGKAESLNVSVSAAICLYEMFRQPKAN